MILQAKDAASDLLAFVEALLGVRVLLLALEEGHVLRLAPQPYVLRRRRQHRRRRDRFSRRIHCACHILFRSISTYATRKKKKKRRKLLRKKNHSHSVWFPRKKKRRENPAGKWKEKKFFLPFTLTWMSFFSGSAEEANVSSRMRELCVSSMREGTLC